MRPYLKRAAPDHVEGNVENDREPEISDPAMLVEQSCNESRSGTHQYDRKQEAKDKRGRMIACGPRHRKDVVERHGNVRDHDLPSCLCERLASYLAFSCRQHRFGFFVAR